MLKHLYVKKPIPVEAYQWDGSTDFRPTPDFHPVLQNFDVGIKLHTAEGWMVPQLRSFIVKGPAGEYWAVREDIFLNTYDAIPQEVKPQGWAGSGLTCRQAMIDEGQSLIPRSCPRCGLGPCQSGKEWV